MKEIKNIIKLSQNELKKFLLNIIETNNFEKENYIKYLSMQYHLTQNVQKDFFLVASHESLFNKLSLRKFLFNFALEEEKHFLIALNDIKNSNAILHSICLDTQLWKNFFDKKIITNPFLRLGATCILENITSESENLLNILLEKADFITTKNVKFITIHRHDESLPHGDEILINLAKANLNDQEYSDLKLGAKYGKIMFMRMLNNCFYN